LGGLPASKALRQFQGRPQWARTNRVLGLAGALSTRAADSKSAQRRSRQSVSERGVYGSLHCADFLPQNRYDFGDLGRRTYPKLTSRHCQNLCPDWGLISVQKLARPHLPPENLTAICSGIPILPPTTISPIPWGSWARCYRKKSCIWHRRALHRRHAQGARDTVPLL